MPTETLTTLADEIHSRPGPVVFLTGAGVSAESGIPTFRGPEGYWQAGGRNYFPEQLATRSAFEATPEVVWRWYLFRRSVCRQARPNPGHEALVRAEAGLGDRFRLVTQNVDGLHRRAGNARVWEIHGNLDYMRCLAECSADLEPVPLDDLWTRERPLARPDRERLRCPRCGGPARPHVLWFDEVYDEPRFRFESSLKAVAEAAALVVAGTSGVTNLPLQMGRLALDRGIPLVVVNAEPSPFSQWAEASPRGLYLQGASGALLPEVVDALLRDGTDQEPEPGAG